MSTTSGSCNCGEYKWEFVGEPAMNAICHCIPCRKTAGSNGSVNVVVKEDDYKVTSGKAKKWTRKGDSGQNVTYSFCDTCCTFMSVNAESMPGLTIVKTGTTDAPQTILDAKPGIEIYTKNRPACFHALDGLTQTEAAPSG